MLLIAMLTMVLVAAAAPAMAQPTEAKISDDVWSKEEKGKAFAKAGDTAAEAPCPDGVVQAKSGDIYAKAPCKPAPPPPPPKEEMKKELPPTGGTSSAALLALGAGALLVGGGLLVRRMVR